MDEKFLEGIQLFNSQKFFECHEALEALWLKSTGEEKVFLHGLIQLAAAFHHQQGGNLVGARSLLEKGWMKLEPFSPAKGGIDLMALRNQLQLWRQHMAREIETGRPSPRTARSFPHIRLLR